MHAPVLVLQDSMKREQGGKVQRANIQAAKAVADIIRTTLGPRSMLKMLLDAAGGIVVTNDGNAILRELDLAHPAAKSMIELSRTQDEEVGDGTTSVIVLAGEMLHVAEAFIDKKYHPTVICRAYGKALEDAIAVLDKIAMTIDVKDRATMLGLVKSCIGTKFTSQFGDLIADLAIDATTIVGVEVGQGLREVDIKKYIKVEKVPGGQLEDSTVLKGVMMNKDVVAPGKMRRKIVNPRIILLDSPLEYKKGENQTNAELLREEDWNVLLKMEEEYIENMCAQILKFKPDVVITEKGLSDLACHYLTPLLHRTRRKTAKQSMKHGTSELWIIFLILLFYTFNLISNVSASIHEYKDEQFIPKSNAFFFHGGTEGLYASKSSSNASPDKPLEGKSFIRFEDVVFLRTKESAEATNAMQSRTGLIETIILEVRDREKIGDAFAKSNALCCTPKLAQEKFCTVGEVMIQHNQDNPLWPLRIQTFFEGKNQEANMLPATVEINSTGMYYLYFMFCDPALKGTIIRGRTVWKNPDGYLPGRMVPLMTFYGLASLAYLVLGFFWFLKFVQFWKDVIQLHYQITAVIALGMSEMALWYFEYANLSATGSRPMVITIWAVTMTAVKKTLSRALLLVVSMGYGVVRPTLGGVTSKVYLLCLMYFIATEALELVEHLGSINDFSRKTKIYLVLPVVFLDASVILWIFSSLSKTLEKLQMRKSMAKLDLYRKFTNSLAIFVLLSIAWVGYELYFNASDPLSELWRISWIIPAFWSLLAFSLLVVICILWAPSSNPTRYAYAGETEDDYDEEAISLTSGVRIMTGVRVIGDSGTTLERKEKKGSALTELVSDKREDPEEDKRE